jgi:hypothetical protein
VSRWSVCALGNRPQQAACRRGGTTACMRSGSARTQITCLPNGRGTSVRTMRPSAPSANPRSEKRVASSSGMASCARGPPNPATLAGPGGGRGSRTRSRSGAPCALARCSGGRPGRSAPGRRQVEHRGTMSRVSDALARSGFRATVSAGLRRPCSREQTTPETRAGSLATRRR